MAGLADLLEAYKNYRGVQDWKLGQQMNRVPGAEEAMDLWGGWNAGGLAGAIKAYHGSPRPEPFTHFSSEFMGSGEGAQAFGKGHYAAERPGIAKGYAQMRGPMFEKSYEREYTPEIDNLLSKETLQEKLAGGGFNKKDQQFIKGIIRQKDPIGYVLKLIDDLQYDINMMGPNSVFAQDRIKRLNQIEKLIPGYIGSGKEVIKGPLRSLYEVSLEWPGARESVDPMSREHFFQWDRQFSTQPKHVKDALFDIIEQHPDVAEPYAKWLAEHNSPGHTTHSLLTLNPQSTIKALGGIIEPLLYERGVPGIAFLDQPSRTKKVGDRTYNYVAFGDEIPRIISHNKPSVLDMLWPKK